MKINTDPFFRCTLSQIWGNFSLETVTKLASVRDIGLALRSEADLLAVGKWIDNCSYGKANIISEWYSNVYMLLLKYVENVAKFVSFYSYIFNN